MQRTTLAALIAGLLVLPAQAQEPHLLDEIVVTATRFTQTTVREPHAVQILDRSSIERSGAISLPELLQQVAGLHVSPLYGAYSVSTSLDARGFGETGDSHVAVFLDGRRLNSLDSNAVNNWHALPLEQIERIEVLRGSGAVLYGDNAMTAVVNIITRAPGAGSHNADLRVGSFGTREAQAGLSGATAGLGWRLAANAAKSDNYRQHNRTNLANVTGNLETGLAAGRASLSFGASRLDSQLPGKLTDAQYAADPRQADPAEVAGGSFFDRRGVFLRPGVDLPLGPDWAFSTELGLEEEDAESWIAPWFSYNDSRARTTSLTPRLRYGAGETRATLGLDWYDSDYRSRRGAAVGTVTDRLHLDRQSLGLYAQASRDVTPTLTLTLGGRWQRVDQAITRNAAQLTNDRAKSAWDVGFSQDLGDGLRLFGKAGHTFRFPKVDELTTFVGLGVDLKPEHGRHADLGLAWKRPGHSLQASLYDLRLKDEIAWNNASFRNENLDATHHRGLELDGRLNLGDAWRLSTAYAWTRATFSQGANAGRDIPLVPRHQGRLALEWAQGPNHASLSLQAVGKRRYGGDYDNSIAPLKGHASLDFSLERRWGHWTGRLDAKNLLDRRYAAVAYEDGFTAPHAIYPSDGRAIYLTLAWRE